MGILEECIAALEEEQYQTATELAHKTGHPPAAVSSTLYRNCIHRNALIKRVQWQSRYRPGGVWLYSTYNHELKRHYERRVRMRPLGT